MELVYLKNYHSSLLDGMKNTNENLSQYNRSFGQDFITASSIHKVKQKFPQRRRLGDQDLVNTLMSLTIATQITRT